MIGIFLECGDYATGFVDCYVFVIFSALASNIDEFSLKVFVESAVKSAAKQVHVFLLCNFYF